MNKRVSGWRIAAVLGGVCACLAGPACQAAAASTASPAVESVADADHGAQLYAARCGACHDVDANGAGPRHAGLNGRLAGTQPGFQYSEALRQSGIVWRANTLDAWLRSPDALVPGNKMHVQLVPEPQDRADLIAWLLRLR